MTAPGFLLLLVVAMLAGGVFWRVNREFIRRDRGAAPASPNEGQIIVRDIAAAERLRREAAETDDPAEKATLNRLADEAQGDVEKLARDLEKNGIG